MLYLNFIGIYNTSMTKKLSCAFIYALLLFLSLSFPLAAKDHALFTRVLKKHVHRGFVDYKGLKKNSTFQSYIRQLEKTDPAKIKGRKKRLAFWINVYNAYTLKLIIENYPIKSITDLHAGGSLWFGVAAGRTIWEKWEFPIYMKKYTLDKIEHKIIRPKFKDARIHAALVCAAKSCPPLRKEAYEGAQLDKQLTQQMRQWLGNKKLNRFAPKEKKLYLSKIFDWFADDFKNSQKDILQVLLPYFSAVTRKQIRKIKREDLDIAYLEYDWSLNERR